MDNSASSDQAREVVLELLRIGLLAIRCRTALSIRYWSRKKELEEWGELCHSLPAVLMGGCKTEALRYFLEWNVASFVQRYPSRDGTDFKQACALFEELAAEVGPVEPA
ncbi:hypothetical protein ABU614_12735 [Lysobacter firmicutimachus]|uniref:Uncharacterized protein n=1 Tax=Lysobacter firmicutimachus TaxID=1792846 RepID=A0AAU8MJJ0_9GAMM